MVHSLAEKRTIAFSKHWSYNLRSDPKRLAFVLSRYHAAAQLVGPGKNIAEFGSGEGIGAPLLSEKSKSYVGIDYDKYAIEVAKQSAFSEKCHFICDDFMDQKLGEFDAIVSLDVIEHIYPKYESHYVETLVNNLTQSGIVIVGTPNIASEKYGSELSKLAHVNLFDMSRLKKLFSRYFTSVFCFGMNDELFHCGFEPMTHYLFCMACNKR